MWFAFDLVDEGRISPASFVQALRQQMRCRKPIGQSAVELGWMVMGQVFDVLAKQATSDLPFGELAVDLGYLTRQQVSELVILQLETMPKFEEVLVETGAISKKDLQHALAKLRGQVATYRERQFECIPESVTTRA